MLDIALRWPGFFFFLPVLLLSCAHIAVIPSLSVKLLIVACHRLSGSAQCAITTPGFINTPIACHLLTILHHFNFNYVLKIILVGEYYESVYKVRGFGSREFCLAKILNSWSQNQRANSTSFNYIFLTVSSWVIKNKLRLAKLILLLRIAANNVNVLV